MNNSPRQRPRLEDVARRVGVSTGSVSLVLSGSPGPSAETRRRVLEAADALGYRPDRTARLLARRRSNLLGVMMDVRSTYHAELVAELHVAAEEAGYDLVLSTVTPSRDSRRAIDTLVDSRCEAVLLLGPDASTSRLTALGEQIPVVVVGRRLSSATVDVVRSADDHGVGQAVDHLVGLGHRDIVFVDGGRGTIATDRRTGYLCGMRRHGLRERAQVVAGDHTESAGIAAATGLLAADDLPTAVVTFNDRSAIGFLDGLVRAGVDVPGRVSVVGYDDSPSAQLPHIDLTTVSQDARRQAEHAVAAAVERLDRGRTEAREVVLEPHLVVRRTTAAPYAGDDRVNGRGAGSTAR